MNTSIEGSTDLPFNKLHVPHDLPRDMCHAINEELHESLVQTCNVNPDDHFCLITRYQPGDMILHPTFMGERDPEKTIIIEIALLNTRTDAQKEALYKDVRQRLNRIGFDARNSIIFLLENGPADWSFSPAGSVKSVLGL